MENLRFISWMAALALSIPIQAIAQAGLTGRVSDTKGQALPGASVRLQGQQRPLHVDAEGGFHLQRLAGPDTLLFSHVGYIAQRVAVGPETPGPLLVYLAAAGTELEEVQVHTGYYSVPAERATGSFTHIGKALLNRSVGTDILSRLEGVTNSLLFDRRNLTGENVSGAPELRVRGLSTIEAGSAPLVVVDRNNHRIRKITPAGVVTTLAGTTQGYLDGTGTAARFNAPADIALDASGNAYVTDEQNQRIRKITPAGVVTTLAGSGVQGNANGTGTAAQFNIPQGLAIDGSGNLYVGDQVGNQIRRVTPAGVVTSFATGVTRPISLERDASGDLYAGLLGHRLARITSAGVVTIFAGTGTAGGENGPPLSAQLNFPGAITFDPQGNRFIADMWNNKVRRMGTGQGYTISPALPAGMAFNRTTGVIGGTPTSPTASTTYTVTARNAGGTFPRTVTFSVGAGAFSSNQNYILKTTYLGRYASAQADPPIDSAMRDITYFDGLGRPMQEVGIRAVQAKTKDVVTPIAYDGFGRQDKDYLAYATTTGVGGAYKSTAVSDQATYYNAPPTGVVQISALGGVTPSFGQRKYEASPLNRVQEQGFPGQAWQPASSRTLTTGHTVVTEYATNNATDTTDKVDTRIVSRYGVTLNSAGVPTLTLNNHYPAGELYVTVSKDENWAGTGTTFSKRLNTVEEYSDKQGRVILRRTFVLSGTAQQLLSTYYVYNDLDQLSFVLTPEMRPDRKGIIAPTATELNRFAYQYRYDRWGRMSYRRLPGGGAWETYNYNKVGWLVFHQDSRQQQEQYDGFASTGQYHTFHKYDGQGRLIIKGVERNRSMTRDAIEGSLSTWGNQWEERSAAGGNLRGYTNLSIPTDSQYMDIMEVNYYDHYGNIPGLPVAPLATHSKLTHGKLVASKVKVIGTSPAVYLWTVYFYDNKGNVVDTYAQHYKNGTATANPAGNHDRTTTTYTFRGAPKLVSRNHFVNGARQVQVNTDHVYDHRERLLDTWMRVNPEGANPPAEPRHISRNHYNEVGQVWKKEVDGTGGVSLNYPITYTYNERGWLRTNNSGLFRQTLRYADTALAANPQYNGNISHQVFMRRGNTGNPLAWVTDTYSYRYDAAGRLTEGTMGGGKGRETLAYDRNGNIRTLQRTGQTNVAVDNLTYDYTGTGNRLKSITDTETAHTPDFQLRGTTNYGYDANGNVTSRLNTGTGTNFTGNDISKIVYNYLDLPQQVTATAGNVSYVYDGRGRKLRSTNGALGGDIRDYVGGIEYRNGTIDIIHTPEGRSVRVNATTYRYEYFVRDHLGNNRTGFAINAPTVPNFKADYYPFGLQYLQPIALAGTPKNNYLYNGKEHQDGIRQLDYGARLYDPVIGRWGAVDPMAEGYHPYSPYNYALNDPIGKLDPNGMWVATADGYFTDDANEIAAFLQQMQGNRGRDKPKEKERKGGGPKELVTLANDKDVTGGYPGQAIEEAVVGGIKWLGGKITGGDMSEGSAEYMAIGIDLAVALFTKGRKGVPDLVSKAAKGGTNALVKTGTQFSKHSLERLAQRGVTQDMAELAISKGQKFYDPLNKSINYVLPNGFGSGKSLLVGTNPLTGEVTTVIRSSKNLINSRFVPIK